MKLFEPRDIGGLRMKNRIIRSATYEGMCDEHGFPTAEYKNLYTGLAEKEIGAVITGFAYISPQGKAMQPAQAGIDSDDKILRFAEVTDAVHSRGGVLFMQIAHTGRQTTRHAAGGTVKGVSDKRSPYFRERTEPLSTLECSETAVQFGHAALRAKKAGFDGVQVHAAHGYLIHQFLLPSLNTRRDRFGIDPETGTGTAFLQEVIQNISEQCGTDFPVLVKISGSDDLKPPFAPEQFINLIRFLDTQEIDGIEISYGTMDNAMNIFRGNVPIKTALNVNPLFKTTNPVKRFYMHRLLLPLFLRRIKPFSSMYNLEFARTAKQHTDKPVITVGGCRSGIDMNNALEQNAADCIGICRPFICEPDLVLTLMKDPEYTSQCINCNLCAVMCDSSSPTRCYKEKNHE
jgi:2,4-dienoyl-CoA reductase-like NADH-dependent reductase (Old Yellow Enzyme family)